MPVTTFQLELLKLLAVNRSEDSHLAGGSALHFEPHSIRYSNDLDFFHDSEQRVDVAFSQDQQLLQENKYILNIELKRVGYIRAIISKNQESTKIEWAHDSAWRFLPVLYSEDRGYYLHPIDLAINKVLALAGRDEPRDYLDIHDIHKRILSLGALCWAACGKDPGFTPFSLLEMLRRRGKYRLEDFSRLRLNIEIDLIGLKNDWLKMLDEAEAFISSSPPAEVGCIYYSSNENEFITPPIKDRDNAIVPHYGTLKGVWPKVYRE